MTEREKLKEIEKNIEEQLAIFSNLVKTQYNGVFDYKLFEEAFYFLESAWQSLNKIDLIKYPLDFTILKNNIAGLQKELVWIKRVEEKKHD